MTNLHQIRRDKKGINTILASLLMVVIVVVAAVMVYAWSTGLLSSLLVQNPVPKETLNPDSYSFPSAYNVTIYVRNTGSAALSLQAYYVKDNSGDSWQLQNWSPAGQPINPNAVLAVNVAIGSSAGQCGSSCQYTGTSGAFPSFVGGNSYVVTVVTTRNNQFNINIVK